MEISKFRILVHAGAFLIGILSFSVFVFLQSSHNSSQEKSFSLVSPQDSLALAPFSVIKPEIIANPVSLGKPETNKISDTEQKTEKNKIAFLKQEQTPPPETPVVSASLSKTSVDFGQSSVLSWTTKNATECFLSDGMNKKKIALNGTETVTSASSTTYTLTCLNNQTEGKDGPITEKSVTLTVNTPKTPVLSVRLSRSSIFLGQSSTLSWTTKNATSCLLVLGTEQKNVALKGTETVSPTSSTTYTLRCSNEQRGGKDGPMAEKSITLNINSPQTPVINLHLSKTSISSGQVVVVSWTATNANHCYLSSGSSMEEVRANDRRTLSPVSSTKYTLRCLNQPGDGKEVVSAEKSVDLTVTGSGH